MKIISHYFHPVVRSIFFCFLTLGMTVPAYSSGDLKITGNLIDDPCTLVTDDENVIVPFDVIVDKYLYLNTNTKPVSFQIRLEDCDVILGSSVSVSFNGTENANIPGFLALDSGSVATNVAIGIQNSNGELIPINSTTPVFPIDGPTVTLDFQGIVQGEPQAIRDKSIGLGTFVATTSFVLNYD
ncbi:fimbrial protein [uncultured Cedecea sp.]|uniref:fimbrial protein n=1 Tax=uncultured Cedecea sp. TaxID=988762 RepID=UPI0026355936|nr:fimbrial protein [uncultured Cedecea sp.]